MAARCWSGRRGGTLYDRFAPPAWGTGLAAELVTAAIDAAAVRLVCADRPADGDLLDRITTHP